MPHPATSGAPRHRPPEPDPAGPFSHTGQDVELDSYLAALAPSAAPDATELTGRFGSAQVFQLRLPELRIEQLRRLAQDRGVSPGALAVDWVIERLDREDTATGPLPPVPAEAQDEPADAGSAGSDDAERVYVVVLTYTVPLTEIDGHVPEHMAWIQEQYDAGRLLASGRRDPRNGGVLLFAHLPRAELDAVLDADPFARHGLADRQVVPFLATSTVDALAPWRDQV